jgi:hypothetical protein
LFTTGTPWFEGSLVSVTAGTLSTISNGSAQAPAQNVAINVPNQVLGGFTTNFTGEPVTVQTIVVHVASSTGATGQLTSVSLVNSSGNVVAGPSDENISSGANTITFNNTVTFPVGVAITLLRVRSVQVLQMVQLTSFQLTRERIGRTLKVRLLDQT